jgi:gliding motility-associated-like protein
MKKILFYPLAISLLFITETLFGQTPEIIMRNGTQSTKTCGADFTDSGGSENNYRNNENFTLTICSDSVNNRHIALVFEQIVLAPNDQLWFYDGNDVNARLIGTSADFGRSQNSIVETTAQNGTGCMTIKFVSNGSGVAAGWVAKVLCIPSCQTVRAQIESSTPAVFPLDTGWIDGCTDTRMAFKGKGIYLLNDIAYHQSDTLLSEFEWNFGDGSPIKKGTEVEHVYTKGGGYIVQLVVKDQRGCKNINYIKQRVRVSPRPTFNVGTVPSEICTGKELLLRGQTGRLDANYQVSTRPNPGSFPTGLVRSETLFIPDNQNQEYRTSVYFTDFAPGQTLTRISDLLRIYVKMEHSYARDLEIKIVCPSKKEIIMHAYSSGGTRNAIIIGDANCNDNTTLVNDPTVNLPGTGAVYGWTPTSTNGTWRDRTTNNNTATNICMPANSGEHRLAPGDYQSENPFDGPGGLAGLFNKGLLGCPLNGEWSLVVKDRIPRDNGWIFEWGIDFKPSLYPSVETFSRQLTDHRWLPNPNISMYSPDSIISKPRNAGIASFVYEVTDNIGCKFDTVVNVSILPPTHPTCRTCTPDFPKLRDTSICTTDAGILMNKTPRLPINNSIVFEVFPYKKIDAAVAPITKPDTSVIVVRNLFQNTLTNPLTQIDSVCFDIGSRASDDIFVQLLAPNNTKIPLMNTQRGGFAFPLRNVCFSPTATRQIATATAPIRGLYQPENGVASWSVLNGTPINGNWKLLVADARGAEKDTINQWSITFKSGNANTYNWSPAAGLSSINAPTTIAKPTTTTRYIFNVVDSMNCTHRDTLNLAVQDSFQTPDVRPGRLTFNSVEINWQAITGATGYEISINGNAWITPNGTLTHRVTGLRTEQQVDFRVRAIGGRCGARIAPISVSSLACIATIGKGVNRRLEVDSVLCYGLPSPLVNFKFATGEAPFTYFIDTFRQNSNGVFFDKIKAGTHRAIFIDGTGCSDTLDFNFGQPDSLNFRVTVDSVKCSGDRTGKITAIASGGTGALTYALNLSPLKRNIGIFDSLPIGRYSIEVEDANRCRKTINTDVFQPTPLTLNLAKTDVSCFGKSTGTVRANVSGGVQSYTYNWRSGEATDRLSSLPIGGYFVTVTDKNGCTRRDSTTLISNTKIVITTLQDSVKCYSEASGQARARATGGRAPYTFNWNNTQFDSVAIRLKTGLQRVTVSDALNCTDTASVVVLQPDSLRFDSLIAVPSACSNTATGAARVTVSGGTKSYQYVWTPNVVATTPSVSSLAIGSYSVTVRDFNNCSKTQSFTIGSPTALALDRFNEIKVKCNGDASGGLSANASGGVGGYTFRWGTTPVQTTDTARNIPAGMYQVTISDRNNCQIVKDTTIGEPTKLVASITQSQNVKCRGEANGIATPSVFGGTGFAGNNRYLFKWSDPLNQNTLIADSLAAGAYIVTVTDANGCTDTANITITEPASIVTTTTTQTRLACFGQNTGEGKVIPSGGAGSYTYRWSNLQSGATVTNLAKSKYFVTVTDINGCTAKDSLEAFTRDSIAATLTLTKPTCFNAPTGSVAITSVSGGAGNNNLTNYFYRWSTTPAQTTPQATNIPGNRQYSVTITDSENCSNVAYVFLTQPGPINLSSVLRPVSCFGGNDGEAQINAFGSINVFTYAWNDAKGQTTQRATGLTAGRYSVVVKDTAGCSKDTTISISQPSRLKMDIKNIVDNKCVGDTTGSIDIAFSGGTPVYNYLWSNGVSEQNQSKLRSGTYILTVSDANGCKFNDTIIVKSPKPVDADVTTMDVRCFGDRNGVITVNAFGGTTPYVYSLDGKNFNGISQIVGLKASNYDVYVKDANGCIWFTKEEVKTPPKFTVEATANVSINLGDKIQLFANPQNARGNVVLTWKQPYDSTLTCLKCANPTANPKSTITYSVIAIDSVGCRATDSVTISVEKPRNIYVPTGFTPNGDMINDKLIVHGRKGTKIDLFRVYDRWGELVYEARVFDINDENAGWNGTFRGQEMMSGQFVWYIEATYIDGAKETLRGHTTLIR